MGLGVGAVITGWYKLKVEPGWRYIPVFFSNDFYFSFVRPDGLQ